METSKAAYYAEQVLKKVEARALAARDISRRDHQMTEQAATLQEKERTIQRQRESLTRFGAAVDDLRHQHERFLELNSAAHALRSELPHRRVLAWVRQSSSERLTSLLMSCAVMVAGTRGARLRDTWTVDIAGVPEEGITLTRWQQMRHAAGFMVAAVRIRGTALTGPLWRPLDWLLSAESRSTTMIAAVVGMQVIYIQRHDGLYKLLTEGWGWCAGCAVALHFFFRWLRKVRGIELAVSGQDTSEG
ncbi:hypothetical protein [Streptomyces tendae]|uniref:Uncharacterized protein n=1 Tax=Streptomyces tendae TaxID=1932 RepID=A0ABW7S7A9_STRTE